MSNLLKSLVLLLSLACLACTDSGSGGADDGQGDSSLSLSQSKSEVVSDANGLITAKVDIAQGESSAQVLISGASFYQLQSITRSDNSTLNADNGLLGFTAAAFQADPFTLNLDLAASGLKNGSYTIKVQLKDARARNVAQAQTLQITKVSKKDADYSSGTLKVNLIMYGPVANSEELRNGLEAALDIWREIYARAGISLDPKWYDFEGGAVLPDPRAGHSFYESISKATRSNAVNIVFASDVAGLNTNARYGVVARANGPAIATAKSAVAISMLAVAGTDGRLDDDSTISIERHNDEVRLAAEVMAQLTAHYLGLDYIVQFAGEKVTVSDNISDTAACLTKTDCRLNADARHNIMFPEPLRKFTEAQERNEANEFYARDIITTTQSRILNANPLVD